ncbi:MAG: AAA domain-containing protein [Clostridiales bacterium]|nr:AAA domain-containing protein [Clostridiales bacterium]
MAITINDIEGFEKKIEEIESQIAREIVGQRSVIRQVIMAILAGGNVLLEGVPGLGKTRLVRTISRVLDLSFNRIQFTPDLMPADVTGTNIVIRDESGNSRFEFQPGPIFSNIVLADEINRATPKTQSALLEAMQEHTVTVSGVTRKLPQPFFVLATQNPIEQEGTYPLPEAQLDRFLFKILVDFPSLDELHDIVDMTTSGNEVHAQRVADGQIIMQLRAVAAGIPIARSVLDYALRLVLATHPEREESPEVVKRYIRYGASPRGAQAIVTTSKVRAIMEGRYNVSFDDIRYTAYPALRHRIFLNFEGMAEGKSPDDLIGDIISQLKE